MKFANGTSWSSWMKDFRFGTFVFLPTGTLRETVDHLRRHYDPLSAKTSPAHITVTQPFLREPSSNDWKSIESVLKQNKSFKAQVGPVVTSPNKKLLWFHVSPAERVLKIRDELHDLGSFNTALPLTKGFIPHMTISEEPRDTFQVVEIIRELNQLHAAEEIDFGSLHWIVPDEDFIFHSARELPLSR